MRPTWIFATGLLLGLCTWLIAAAQLPNAAEQRNTMIRELQRLNQQTLAQAKQTEKSLQLLAAMKAELQAIRSNTGK